MAIQTLTRVLFAVVAAVVVIISPASQAVSAAATIGVNYGANADNLPPPDKVAAFLRKNTIVDRVKLFDANPAFIRAFASTGISVVITAGNGDIPDLGARGGAAANAWVATNIAPFYPSTNITLVAVGNEVLASGDRNLIARLLPAMRNMASALAAAGFPAIRVCSPHSLGILAASEPPSSGRFRQGYDRAIFAPMLEFHRKTHSPFVVNPYPYFGYTPRTLNYALFRPNPGVFDQATGINYTSMFEAQMDAVYTAMKRLGYEDVEIMVGETGWPSVAEAGQIGVSADDAAAYNGNLVRLVNSGLGTPLMPGRRFGTYIFALFNENLKPGPVAERNWGLLRPDFSQVYDIGILQNVDGQPNENPNAPAHAPATAGKLWCVPKPDATETELQNNINYVCGSSTVNCAPIQEGGLCFDPNTVQAHAAYAMNAYYQANGHDDVNCYFAGTGVVTMTDPSYGKCKLDA